MTVSFNSPAHSVPVSYFSTSSPPPLFSLFGASHHTVWLPVAFLSILPASPCLLSYAYSLPTLASSFGLQPQSATAKGSGPYPGSNSGIRRANVMNQATIDSFQASKDRHLFGINPLIGRKFLTIVSLSPTLCANVSYATPVFQGHRPKASDPQGVYPPNAKG